MKNNSRGLMPRLLFCRDARLVPETTISVRALAPSFLLGTLLLRCLLGGFLFGRLFWRLLLGRLRTSAARGFGRSSRLGFLFLHHRNRFPHFGQPGFFLFFFFF